MAPKDLFTASQSSIATYKHPVDLPVSPPPPPPQVLLLAELPIAANIKVKIQDLEPFEAATDARCEEF